jgi:hypothetical protein
LAASEIRQMLGNIEVQQQQFAEIGNEHLFPDASIPITFTKVSNQNFHSHLCEKSICFYL